MDHDVLDAVTPRQCIRDRGKLHEVGASADDGEQAPQWRSHARLEKPGEPVDRRGNGEQQRYRADARLGNPRSTLRHHDAVAGTQVELVERGSGITESGIRTITLL